MRLFASPSSPEGRADRCRHRAPDRARLALRPPLARRRAAGAGRRRDRRRGRGLRRLRPGAARSGCDRIGERHPAVHLLVSNAGIPGGGGFLDLPAERIEQVIATTTSAASGRYARSRRCWRPAPSDVVNVASVAGVYSVGGSSGPYAASKHASSRSPAASPPSWRLAGSVSTRSTRARSAPRASPRTGCRTRFERFVLEPERAAEAILRAVEKGKPESYVFGAYRIAGLLQAALPGTLVRLSARRARSR